VARCLLRAAKENEKRSEGKTRRKEERRGDVRDGGGEGGLSVIDVLVGEKKAKVRS